MVLLLLQMFKIGKFGIRIWISSLLGKRNLAMLGVDSHLITGSSRDLLLPLPRRMLSCLPFACFVHFLPFLLPWTELMVWLQLCCGVKAGGIFWRTLLQTAVPTPIFPFLPILYTAQVESVQNRWTHLWPKVVKQKPLCWPWCQAVLDQRQIDQEWYPISRLS